MYVRTLLTKNKSNPPRQKNYLHDWNFTYVERSKIFYIRKFREVFFSFFTVEKHLPWYGREGKLKTNDLQKLLKKLQWASFFLDYSIMIDDWIDKKRTKLIGALIKQWSSFEDKRLRNSSIAWPFDCCSSRSPLLDTSVFVNTYVRTYV